MKINKRIIPNKQTKFVAENESDTDKRCIECKIS